MKKEEFLQYFFEILNADNTDYFVFGTYKYLPKHNGESDIDIIVSDKDTSLIETTLLNIAQKGSVTLASYYKNCSTIFYRFLTTEWGIQIDIFQQGLHYRGVSYFPIEKLRPYIITHNSIVKALNENRGYYVGFFKEVIHTGKAKEKYIEAVKNAFEDNKALWIDEINELFGHNTALLINKNSQPYQLDQITKALQKAMQKSILKGKTFSVLKDRFQSLLRLFSLRPGYTIVVEGTDGSGKSSIINSITPILNEAFHNGIIYSHLRPHYIPDIAELFGKRKKDNFSTTKVVSNPHAEKSAGLIGSLARWSYYLIDYTFGYLRKVWLPIHSKSKVFIFDRYYYEYYLDQRRSHVNLPMWIIRLGEFFIPKPDLILCLGGDPDKIYARKPETSLQEVTRQTSVLKDFCSKRKNAVWIDTTVAPEESIAAAMKAIIEMMSKRFDIADLQ